MRSQCRTPLRARPRRCRAPARSRLRAASPDHLRPLEAGSPGDDRAGIGVEPLLEQRAVDTAEIGGRAEIALLVQMVEPGVLADQPAVHTGANDEADPGRAVIGAA